MKTPAALPLQLIAIYLRQSQMRMDEHFDPLLPGQELHPKFRTESRPPKIAKRTGPNGELIQACTFEIGFGFRYDAPPREGEGGENATDDRTLAEVTADVAISYLIVDSQATDAEQIAQWGQTSALIHAWPYWREFNHSALTRMGLPITLMPLLDIQAVKESAEIGADADAHLKRVPKKRSRSAASP